MRQPLYRSHGACVVGIDDDASVFWHQRGKAVERVLHVGQVFEKIQVIGLYIEDYGHRGEKAEERVAVFAGFQHNRVTVAYTVAGTEQRQRAAHHDCGIQGGSHGDMCHHRSGCGFAVSAGDAHGVFIMLHNGAPGLGALKYRNPLRMGRSDFGIGIVHGGSADNIVAAADIFSTVTNGDLDPQAAQMVYGIALAHIGTVYGNAGAVQHFGQRGHGHAADADQMCACSGDHIMTDIFHKNLQRMISRRRRAKRGGCKILKKHYNIIILKPAECNTVFAS